MACGTTATVTKSTPYSTVPTFGTSTNSPFLWSPWLMTSVGWSKVVLSERNERISHSVGSCSIGVWSKDSICICCIIGVELIKVLRVLLRIISTSETDSQGMRARDPGMLPFKIGIGFGDNVDRVPRCIASPSRTSPSYINSTHSIITYFINTALISKVWDAVKITNRRRRRRIVHSDCQKL